MPSGLVCSATSCSSNTGGYCHSAMIQIQGISADRIEETKCATYSKNTFGNNLKNVINTNYTGFLKQDLYESQPMHPDVTCSAGSCKHNDGGRCTENKLQIYSPYEDVTMCRNFDKWKHCCK